MSFLTRAREDTANTFRVPGYLSGVRTLAYDSVMVIAHALKSWIAVNESCAATGSLSALLAAMQAELEFDDATACQLVSGTPYQQRGLLLAIIRKQQFQGVSGPIVLDQNGDRLGEYAVVNQVSSRTHLLATSQRCAFCPSAALQCVVASARCVPDHWHRGSESESDPRRRQPIVARRQPRPGRDPSRP